MTDVGTQITLDGSGSSDPDGDELTYSWSLDTPSGSNASLADPSAEQTTFTPDVEGDYVAELEVSDGSASDTDDATVQAQDGTTELNSNITSDRTLSADTTYLVTSTVAVDGGATLAIEAGTEIMFENDVALWVNSGGAIDANGTDGNPITMTATEGNEQQGWWRGVAIYSSNINNTLNHVEIRHAGSTDMSGISEATNVALEGGATLNLTNTTITDGGGYGVYLDGSDATLESFSANSFTNNTDAPMWIPFTNIGTIDAATSFASDTYVRVYGASLSNDLTISALSGDTPYRFSSKPETGSASVTIEPGVEMTFENNVAFWVNSGSSLVADGTSDDPITMTATPGNEQQGWWRGVAIYSSNVNNTLNHLEIRHAGSTDMSGISEATNVALEGGATLNLTNTTITDGGGYGVYLDGSDATLESFSANSFTNNTDAPMWIPFTNIGTIDAGSSFADGTYVRVYGASLSNDLTISALSGDTPYRFSSRPETGSASVTVEPGVEMTFENDVAFWVNSGSALVADGTSDDPITMTATSGNEQQSWWRGVAIYSSNVNNTLNHLEIRHGGSTDMSGISEATNVAIEGGATLNLTNSAITDSGGNGVYCDASDASLSASGNSYSNNAGVNVENCQ